jgi:hypothetical protein
MGNVSRLVPSIHPSLGLGGPDDVFPHNAAFADLTVLPRRSTPSWMPRRPSPPRRSPTRRPQLRAAAAAEFAASGGPSRWED